ncbi:SemiSWEET transporter [Cytophaga sp. FL35]|uniref:SemiSWEET family sugar transporter n=1 Tax=Cytophaga sp. FL35 TaxID=1904456 RepID=UPI001653E666|nr:SemiSWEET transporter [Cytophaga sp. FL35]MBC7000877.1 SemiSWEET transporter [Cytophaga sp. FL35]
MQVTEIIGILAGVFTTIAALPQIITAIRNRACKDVSPIMFIILIIGVGLWTIYGIMKEDWPIIVTNGISTILNGSMLFLIFKFK